MQIFKVPGHMVFVGQADVILYVTNRPHVFSVLLPYLGCHDIPSCEFQLQIPAAVI
jgi:hypothetical protein